MEILKRALKRYLSCFSLHVSVLQVFAVSDGMLLRTVAVKMTHVGGMRFSVCEEFC